MEEIFGDFRKTPEQRRDEYRELQALYGMDPDYFKDARKQSIDLGLIEAGLRIAGGTSANPLENISAGATPALQAFAKEQSRLSGAQRLENLAAMKSYQDSVASDKALSVEMYKAKQAADFLKKGSLCLVEGAMKIDVVSKNEVRQLEVKLLPVAAFVLFWSCNL